MRLLFINQYYAPDYAATAQQMADLCERLAAQGNQVDVIAARALYDGRDLKLPAREIINGVHVHRVGLADASRARFRHRFIGYLSFLVQAFWLAHRLKRPDVVVTLTTPPLVSLLGAWLRLTRRCRFVFWVMDIYPDIAEAAGLLRRLRFIAPIWSRLARIGYNAADRVIVLGPDMRAVLASKGVPSEKIEVLPNWSDPSEVHPVEPADNAFRQRHLRAGQFTVMYSGNMGACHTFAPLFQVLPGLNGHDPYDFVFVGSGIKKNELTEKLGTLGDRVRFLPYQDRAALAESLSAPDAHLVTLDPRFDGLLVPSKIYGIMAAAKPVLFVGSEQNEIARTIREARCGLIVPPEDPGAFIAAIRQLASQPDETREMGRRGRYHLEENFGRKQSTDRFIDLLEAQSRRARPVADTPNTPRSGVNARDVRLGAAAEHHAAPVPK